MRKQICSLVPAVAAGVLVAAAVLPGSAAPAGDRCLAGPGKAAPDGARWRYRVDHANGRHCWYLRANASKAHRVTSPRRPAAQPTVQSSQSPSPRTADPPPPAPAPSAKDASLAGDYFTFAWWTTHSKALDASDRAAPTAEMPLPAPPAPGEEGASAEDAGPPAAVATAAPARWKAAPQHIATVLTAALALAGLGGHVMVRRATRRRSRDHRAFGGFVPPVPKGRIRNLADAIAAGRATDETYGEPDEPSERCEPSERREPREHCEPSDLAVVVAAARRAALAGDRTSEHSPDDYAPRAHPRAAGVTAGGGRTAGAGRTAAAGPTAGAGAAAAPRQDDAPDQAPDVSGASAVLWVDEPLAPATPTHPLTVEVDDLHRFLRDWELAAA
jgi:hypothetical protein